MKVLVTGATGFIGSALCPRLRDGGHTVVALSRDVASARDRVPSLRGAFDWAPLAEPPPPAALDGVEAVVHLAGESVAGRWGATQRAAIRDSRVIGTRHLVAGIKAAASPPELLVSSSAIGYYGDRGDEELTEESSPGDDFLAEVCQAWEAEARAAESPATRVVVLRTGIVLGQGGGALEKMLLPAKLGAGGPLGSGRQWWSWVHLEDALGIVEHALQRDPGGVLNNTAPTPVRQRDFARQLGRVLHRPAFMPAPAFALRLALGGFATELLSSKRVVPRRTQATGYTYRFPDLGAALDDLLG